ncbi:MAG: hypothetical protein LBD96_04710 [Treponema sp.]|jgi:hypothetical protein|nr:hypothetical protein [Treponema sp.]
MKSANQSIREYAKQYAELARSPAQDEKRRLWRRLNSFHFEKPLIYMRSVPYYEFFDFSVVKNEDPFLNGIERNLATVVLYQQKLKDDFIFEPWVKVNAVFSLPGVNRWGVPCGMGEKPKDHGAAAFKPPIVTEEDLAKVQPAESIIDEKATAERIEKAQDAIGNILDVVPDRQGLFSCMWNRDISTDLAKLRGLEQFMWDIYDRPEWLHRLIALMRDTVLKDIEKTEQEGNFRRYNNENQAMSYCEELPVPDASLTGRKTRELWGFMASQEFTGVGPDLYEEFMLNYQMPIMERFGMIAYGCCEDMTAKIPVLRKIKNLRRVAITPFSDVRKCAEQIGKDYVVSYRPNPSSMIANGLDEDLVRGILKRDFEILKENHCIIDVTLKDVETIAGKPENMIRWVEIVRQMGEEIF